MTSSISMFSKAAIVALFSVTALTSQAATTTSSSHSITTYRLTGTVEQVDLANNLVTLKQDSVTELGWPARVASYHVNNVQILNSMKEGQKIGATFTAEDRFHPVLKSLYLAQK